nr:ABC transporter permease subunit [Ammoniphilus sp. YIM 78166]
MALPGLIWFAVFRYIPMGGSIIAFQDYNVFKGITGSPFVGLKHFQHFIQFPEFLQILKNTLLINLYDILFAFPAPIILALLLNEVGKMAFKRTIQTIVYMPHFLSWVIIGGIFINLLSPETGLVNHFIKALGYDPIYFMAKTEYIRSILVGSGVWRDVGWGTIIYLAAIAGINPSLYEAAAVDGASRLRQVFVITLPSLLPTIMILFLLQIGNFLDFGFERVWVFMNGLNRENADIFDTYIYRAGLLNAQFSYTTAIGLFKSVVGLILLVTCNKLSKKLTGNGLY